MAMLRFTVPGQPVAKGRARSAIRGGRIAHYTPDKTAAYERRVRSACMEVMEAAGIVEPIKGAVSVQLVATFEIPASWSKVKRNQALSGDLLHITKPDLDNVIKAVFDGCNSAIWVDDCQVCSLVASKGYGSAPSVEVMIEWIEH